ncbi:hypothetical protein [Streptomyces ziwulingensis]|uniref:Secreted protein n=1 Tax=Streptomyces ziwulingensis TaxID=1045501 RepID=A0ABP9BVA8_9ACTN
MKSLKAAAVVVGSVVVAGAAAPAFAQDTSNLTPTSINGAVNTLTAGPIDPLPLKQQSSALDTESKDSALHAVKGATKNLNAKGGLLGGLPLGR